MSSFAWPTDDGWPYPDGDLDVVDLGAEDDDDLLAIRLMPRHLFAGLDDMEREVVTSRFGLGGHQALTMNQLGAVTGLGSEDLDHTLEAALAKLRVNFTA